MFGVGFVDWFVGWRDRYRFLNVWVVSIVRVTLRLELEVYI